MKNYIAKYTPWICTAGLVAVSVQWFSIRQELGATREQFHFFRDYARIEIGMNDYDVTRIIGRKPVRTINLDWGTKIGDLTEYPNGFPRRIVFKPKHSDDNAQSFPPESPIVWYRYFYPDDSWIAIACIGDDGQRAMSALPIIKKLYYRPDGR